MKLRCFKKGMTLLELMVAVSVLSVGIVVILHARLGVIVALDTAANKMRAWQILENKMSVLEQAVLEEGGIIMQSQQEDMMVGVRRAKWTLEMASVDMDGDGEEYEAWQWEENQPRLLEVTMKISWNEKKKNKNVVLAAYLPEKIE